MGKTVLIVDDSKFTRKLLQVPLTKEGYWVESLGSPSEAIEFVMSRKPDLIITDLKMPSLMDGLGFLKMLALEVAHIPVLIYTADPNAKAAVGDIGIQKLGYINKPISPEFLLKRVAEILA